MKITQEADYALRIVNFLARQGYDQRIDAKTLSYKEGIPTRFALKIFRKLTQAGITKAYRGVNGGYALSRKPELITLKDVIEAIDGKIFISRCLYDEDCCNLHRTNKCTIHKALEEIRDNVVKELERINFKDLDKE